VHSLAHKLLTDIRQDELMHAGNRIGVAVSGGIDSVALLRLLLELRQELGIVLTVVHVNHRLRGAESEADEAFCSSLAREYDLPLFVMQADVGNDAMHRRISLETAAREARYRFFGELLRAGKFDKVATGHTLDDQAETVLMRVIRGTGMRGLGAIHPHLQLADQPGEIVRPLLTVRRCELEVYLRELQQPWREDSTNRDHAFTRNRVRHVLMPLLQREFNPNIAENLTDLAEIARAEEDYWESEAEGWMGTAVQWFSADEALPRTQNELVQIAGMAAHNSQPTGEETEIPGGQPRSAALNLQWLLSEPLALQRQVIKSIADEAGFPVEFKHVEQILRFTADPEAEGKQIALPHGWKAIREEELLVFEPPGPGEEEPADYEYRLKVPGEVYIPEADVRLQALQVVPDAGHEGYNPDQLLNPALLQQEFVVRNWRPGERFWPAHTKAPKKMKELLQEHHLTGPQKKQWPVVVSGAEIVWVPGFAVGARFQAEKSAKNAILLREVTED
jgi:tRNA(Ile)-lysidine synthase